LGIPLIAGPGAITAMILLAGRMGDMVGIALLIGVAAVILALAYLVFRLARPLERLLRPSGQAVFARLLGVLLAALAVQYVADGILEFRA
jgi:multiple antibiotic resistance protein